jgi:hypothetical protein
MGNVLRDHRLAHSIAAAQDQVATWGEEVQVEGALDERTVDLLGPVPFEIRDGLKAAQASLGQPALKAAASSVFSFGSGHFLDELTGAPTLGGGSCQQVVQALGSDDQTKLLQADRQLTVGGRSLCH